MERLRRLVGGGPRQQAAPPPPRERITGRGPAFELPASWQLPARKTAEVRYKRDRLAAGMRSRTAARERTIQRQIIFALVAVAALAVAGAIVASRYLRSGTLPAAVRGVWRTDGPRYSQRLLELSGSRLAFQTSDSTADIRPIRGVRRTVGDETTTYDVEYEADGATYVFSFTYYAGPPEELRFVHQPFMVWTRVTDRRRLLPELY